MGERWGKQVELFLSTYVNKVDRKGRVSVPATFRSTLADQSPAEPGSCISLRCGCRPSSAPAATASRKCSERIDTLEQFSDEYENLTQIFADSHPMTMDSGGPHRSCPRRSRSMPRIGGDVAFVGLGAMFQLWDPARYEEHRAAVRERSRRQGTTLPPRGRRGPSCGRRRGVTRAGARSAQAESAEDEPRRRPGSGTPESASDQIASGHVPVLLDAVVEALAPRDGAIYVDGTFGAGGYSAALLAAARCRVVGIDRDPVALRRGAALAAAYPGRLQLIEGRFGDMERLVAAAISRPDRRHRARSRRLVDAARCRRARLFVPARRAARHAHGRRGARARPTSSPGFPKASWPGLIRSLGEERFAAPRRAGDRRGAPACADSPHRRACRDRARRDPDTRARARSGYPHVSGAAHCGQ